MFINLFVNNFDAWELHQGDPDEIESPQIRRSFQPPACNNGDSHDQVERTS